MKFNNKSCKTTVILGAGATKGALKGFHYNGHNLNFPTNKNFLNDAKKFVEASRNSQLKKSLNNILDFLYEDIALPKTYSPDMEELFSYIYSSKDFRKIFSKSRGRISKKVITNDIDDFFHLITYYFRLVEEKAIKQGSYNLYRKFVSLLENGDTIISLNYETVIDNILYQNNWDPGVGYGDKSFRRKIPGYKVNNSSRKLDVNLFKLHGSLNWLVKKSQGKGLDMIFSKKPLIVLKPNNLRKNEKRGYFVQIIPPIYGKYFSHEFWEKLWTDAFRSIVASDCLIIIGCSLIPTDFHLRAFMGRVKAMKKSNNQKFKKLIVADPNTNSTKEQDCPFEKFKKALKGCVAENIKYRSFNKLLRRLSGANSHIK